MRHVLVIGNWKMNGNAQSIDALLDGLKSGCDSINGENVKLGVCPPAVYIERSVAKLNGTAIQVGAQNLCGESIEGAYTGEVSGQMLTDVGCHFVLCGHSERREYYSETNEVVAKKTAMALKLGLTPVLCVGETLAQRESGDAIDVIQSQLNAVETEIGDQLANIVIAYEPVWAIGTGLTATPEQAQEVHLAIREWLRSKVSESADNVFVLYGGSVKGSNAVELFAQKDINGALVGGASLKADDFYSIARAAG